MHCQHLYKWVGMFSRLERYEELAFMDIVNTLCLVSASIAVVVGVLQMVRVAVEQIRKEAVSNDQ